MSTFMHMNKDTSSKNMGAAARRSERNMSLVNTMKNTSGKKNGISASRSKSKPSARSRITPEDIRCRAYEIFCERNGRGGDHVSDWLQAERELTSATKGTRIGNRSGGRHDTYDRSELKPQARGGSYMPEVDRKPRPAPTAEHAFVAPCFSLVGREKARRHHHGAFVMHRIGEIPQTDNPVSRKGPNAQY